MIWTHTIILKHCGNYCKSQDLVWDPGPKNCIQWRLHPNYLETWNAKTCHNMSCNLPFQEYMWLIDPYRAWIQWNFPLHWYWNTWTPFEAWPGIDDTLLSFCNYFFQICTGEVLHYRDFMRKIASILYNQYKQHIAFHCKNLTFWLNAKVIYRHKCQMAGHHEFLACLCQFFKGQPRIALVGFNVPDKDGRKRRKKFLLTHGNKVWISLITWINVKQESYLHH